MKSSSKCICAFALFIVFTTSVRAQEEQWTNYLGKSFDSVVNVVKARYAACQKEVITQPTPSVQATCYPYQFMGEYGLLILRRSKSGRVEACSWVRGDYASANEQIAKLKNTDRQKLSYSAGDLDKTFDAAWNHYTKKFGVTMDATDEGGYVWNAANQPVRYVLTRTANRVEFSMEQYASYGESHSNTRQLAVNQ